MSERVDPLQSDPAPQPEGGEHGGLAGQAARGVLWAFLAIAGGKLVWLGAMAVLARLLAPADFGLLAFGLVFVTYLEAVGDLGTSAALIYWPDRDRDSIARTAQATFIVNLATGALFFAITWWAAPAAADFFANERAVPILRALAWAFPLKALGNAHDALLQKELRFRARVVPELGLALVKTAVAVTMAFAGFGVWSLVGGQLFGLAAWTLGLWLVVPWRPRLTLPGDRLRPVLAYGRGIVLVNVLAAVVHHADLVVVGRFLGTAALGFYQIAYKVPEMTVTVAIWVAGRVLFPTLSRLHAAGGEMAAGWLAALRYTALLAVPAAVGLFFVAEPLVLLLYGEPWRPSIPLLQALALYTGLRAIGSPGGDLLKAIGRSQLLAGLAVAKAAVLVPVLVLAAQRSLAAVAWALVAVTAATALLNLAVASHLIGSGWRRIGAALWPSLGGAGAIAAALAAWRAGGIALPPALSLPVQVAAGVVVYLVALRWIEPGVLRRAVDSLRRGRPAPDLAEVAGR
jgi:PST family polysaccharide transporter